MPFLDPGRKTHTGGSDLWISNNSNGKEQKRSFAGSIIRQSYDLKPIADVLQSTNECKFLVKSQNEMK